MVSKQQDDNLSKISPVLFMATDGQPMSFFLRPSPAKRKLQPLIAAGGGLLCSVQQPGAILLIDPVEGSPIPASATHWYVSTQYILDCVDKQEQLNIDDYRLNPGSLPAKNTKGNSYRGRFPYTAEEDAAILSYVNKCKAEIGGNRIWQEMEKEGVTSHSWQSMKYRYRCQLAQKHSEVVEKTTAEGDTDAETMIDAQSTSAEDKPVEVPVCPQEEVEAVDPQADQHPVNNPEETAEAASFDSPQREPPPPEIAKPETAVSTPKEPRTEDSSSVQPDPSLQTTEKLKPSPASTPSQRRSTRRHPQLSESPSPQQYSRKLRSSAKSAARRSPSPLQSKKTKSAAQVDLQEVDRVEEPPPKKARGKRNSGSQNAEVRLDSASETEPAPQKAKCKQKRNLGILEMATKEFEDSSDQSGEDEAADNRAEAEMRNPAETEAHPLTEDAAGSPQSTPEIAPHPDPRESAQEIQPASNACQPPGGAAAAVDANSKAHLFIFDSESQEEAGSQAASGDGLAPVSANLKPTADTISAFALTQAQLEEDKESVTQLMRDTKRDLVSVTKALLKTSGDFSEARLLLLGSLSSGRRWHCSDDELLMSGDAAMRDKLLEKYGEEGIARRIVFLELQA